LKAAADLARRLPADQKPGFFEKPGFSLSVLVVELALELGR